MPAPSIPAGDIRASLTFLKPDPLHDHEKPYRLRYDPGPGIPRTNCTTLSQENIVIKDIRGQEDAYSLDQNGFEVVELESELSPKAFLDIERVKDVWYDELSTMLKNRYGAKRVEVLEHGIRRRHANFPISTGEDYEYLQPTSIIHVDFTPHSAEVISEKALGVDPASWQRLQTLNIWKPLRGPLSDWPLAVCDSRTLNPPKNCIATDVVEREGYTENYQVYYHPDMKFHYISGQSDKEVMVFRQTDTKQGCGTGVAHAGFSNPKTVVGERPRESIETRAFVYY
ncbi:putative CmcJ-like methyltransferase [Polyplosphaeria fusca]|uniref:CmcJ-like methyltransferase n=1 Tax=Polyplosphaeria fusca TaxID=682080 RepID=A0A9P4V4N8_9PLEO|nr:putative CmcJ-like methyltransferase [Polyplosphaeria fusca]